MAPLEISLPNEIVDQIIDYLHEDRPTLKNCSIVAKSWLPSAQLHLFHRIILQSISPLHEDYLDLTDESQWANERLLELFDRTPRVASYVRTLEVRNFERGKDGAKWEQINSSAAAVIERLPNVTNLTLFRVDWAILAPSLTQAVTRKLHSPSLKHLTLALFSIPTFSTLISLLSHSINLKSLKVTFLACSNCDVPEHIDSNELDYAPRSIQVDHLLHFHSVHLGAFTDWFQRPYCAFDFGNLQSLGIHRLSAFHFRRIEYMLQCVGGSLRELELQGPYRMAVPESNVHLGYTPQLRMLTLVNVQQTDSYNSIPWILSLLDPIDPTQVHPLQCLNIDLHIDHFDAERTHQWQEWAALDVLLAQRKFSSVESLVITVSSFGSPTPSTVLSLLGDQLDYLSRAKKLDIRSTRGLPTSKIMIS